MGPDDNLVILEVKSSHRVENPKELLKDIDSVNCMTHVENGYYRGVYLIYGKLEDKLKNTLVHYYCENCNPASSILIFHEVAGQQAVIYK
jgi:hypothetical protein